MVDLGMVDIDKVGGHTRYWGCCKLAVRGGFSQSRKVAELGLRLRNEESQGRSTLGERGD
jgi:hypothetical protein